MSHISSQAEHLQMRYVGTGHSDITKFEWAVNQHRDSFSSYIGHVPMMNFIALVENESVGRVRYRLLEKMLQPCGKPPKVDSE
ncbi:putative splicing factor 3B subunit 5 [Paratrimastix pyriformis]|uniref:Splicing factor subunit n=1 Tax=Paratrimastix pyriformis TaxID=342808 RepID=A0ABQ8UNQ9_9EUKA|nr:putative splicing factor 3B subunit 5 [Paratrimastix pyriformis]